MQADPWKDVLSCRQVLVQGLVHVPQQSNASHNGCE
jgi:hypothetical protein